MVIPRARTMGGGNCEGASVGRPCVAEMVLDGTVSFVSAIVDSSPEEAFSFYVIIEHVVLRTMKKKRASLKNGVSKRVFNATSCCYAFQVFSHFFCLSRQKPHLRKVAPRPRPRSLALSLSPTPPHTPHSPQPPPACRTTVRVSNPQEKEKNNPTYIFFAPFFPPLPLPFVFTRISRR